VNEADKNMLVAEVKKEDGEASRGFCEQARRTNFFKSTRRLSIRMPGGGTKRRMRAQAEEVSRLKNVNFLRNSKMRYASHATGSKSPGSYSGKKKSRGHRSSH